MSAGAWIFWLSFHFVAWVYFYYPLLLELWARLASRPVQRAEGHQPTISVVVAAYNEAANLERRIANLLEQDYPADRVEIVVVSDGSTDGTDDLLEVLAHRIPNIKVLTRRANGGKAVALNAGLEAAGGELIVFADARQTFAPDVLARLAENFADPRIASISGELILTDGETGVAAQVGVYWKYEKWIRRNESAVASMLGATGAIYAIRRALYRPLPPGTLLDDFLTPMRLVLDGHRAIFDGRALAYDRASEKAGQEFKRKVRTLAGNFQAFAAEPGMLLPWRNPSTWFQVWMHKFCRLLVPWALLPMLVGALIQPGWFYTLAALGQIAFYGMAFVGWTCEKVGRPMPGRLVSLAYTFCTLNLAAALGLVAWLRGGGTPNVWRKAYTERG